MGSGSGINPPRASHASHAARRAVLKLPLFCDPVPVFASFDMFSHLLHRKNPVCHSSRARARALSVSLRFTRDSWTDSLDPVPLELPLKRVKCNERSDVTFLSRERPL